jgi:hypothetical protein
MRRQSSLWRGIVVAVSMIAGVSAMSPALAASPDTKIHRSIQELVKAQGSFCFPDGFGGCLLADPPVKNYIFFLVNATGWIAAVDYAGLEDRWLKDTSDGNRTFGTKFSGSVTELALPDGRAEITIKLHTKRVAARVFQQSDGTLLFGNTTPDVLAGAQPAIGESSFEFIFINPSVGMPLPDLVQVAFAPIPGQEFVRSEFQASATGPLHAAFGVKDGTRGRMRVDMISTAANLSVKEIIDLKVIRGE